MAEPRVHRTGRDHAGAAGRRQPGAALEGTNEYLPRCGERPDKRHVGARRENHRQACRRAAHRDQLVLVVVVDDRDQVRIGNGDPGETQRRVQRRNDRVDVLGARGHDRDVSRAERHRGKLDGHAPHPGGHLRDPLDPEPPATCRDVQRVGFPAFEDKPADAPQAVAAQFGRRPVRIEEERLRYRP